MSDERWEDLVGSPPPSLHPAYRPRPLGRRWRRAFRRKGRALMAFAVGYALVVVGVLWVSWPYL